MYEWIKECLTTPQRKHYIGYFMKSQVTNMYVLKHSVERFFLKR